MISSRTISSALARMLFIFCTHAIGSAAFKLSVTPSLFFIFSISVSICTWFNASITSETFIGSKLTDTFPFLKMVSIWFRVSRFWGFKLLSQLYPKRLNLPMRTNEPVEYAAFVDGEKTQILIFAQDQDYHKNETHEITIEVNCDAKNVTQQRIDDTHCNPKAEWVKLGSPDNLTLEQVEGIKEKTHLRAEPLPFTAENGATKLSVRLRTNDVVLITLTQE